MRKKTGEQTSCKGDCAKEPCHAKKLGFEMFIFKFGRFCAWALLVFIALYFISGFGITKPSLIYSWTGGLISKGRAFRIHDMLVLPTAFAAICHTLIAIRFAMIRWKVKKQKLLNWIFIIIGVVLFALTSVAYFS